MRTFKLLSILFLSVLIASCSNDDDNSGDDTTADARAELYATNSSNGNVTRYDFSGEGEAATDTFVNLSTDSEGLYYDEDNDELTVVSRSSLQLTTYADISLLEGGVNIDIAFSSSADLESPRDIAVNGNVYVVADNADVDGNPATADGRFFVYTKSGDSFTLRNTVTTNFAVWGIEFVGNDLYAVVDQTNQLAVFADFESTFTETQAYEATKTIAIEGIVRTHGIAFDGSTMILTDIGDAMVDDDGAFHIIGNFESQFSAVPDGGTLSVGSQTRVEGSDTFLGNPVAAEYDAESNTVFIAEKANGGGRVLAFSDVQSGGNIAPNVNNSLSGANSLYFYSED